MPWSTLPRILFLTVPYAGGAVGKEKTMEILHERVAGLDVHKNTVVACVRVVTGGQTARECRTFSTTTDGLEALRVWLSECRCTHVAMEATGVYWTPILRILGDGEFELIVVNAAHFKNVPGRKTDMNDAMWLADLLAFGLVKASFVPTEQMHELRSLTRTRKQLVREQTRHVQRIQKTLTEANIRLDSVISDIMGASGRRIIEAMIAGVRQPRKLADLAGKQIKATPKELYDALHGRLTDHHRFLLELHLRQWDGLDTAIRTIDLEIDQRITLIDERRRASDPPFRALIENLDTAPGVSAVAAPAKALASAQGCTLAQDNARSMRLGGDPQEGQLLPGSVPPSPTQAWPAKGDLRRRRLNPYRHLSHAQERNRAPRSRYGSLRPPINRCSSQATRRPTR
jgi:transposase